ncbi:MAG: AAA family ATPase, partial [Clostridia bacterium]|nr:AAA family ATPase [Clostridia bacterium]
MKLLHLTLTNFQGIRALRIEPNGENAAIYGDNGTGKTTVFNAFTWLLFGASSTGVKDFSPKTKGADGDIHGLEHSVEGRLLTEDGKLVTLKRTFKEVYTKKRGSATEEFDGHTTDYHVNGVPCKEKEYTDAVTSLFGSQERAKMLSIPFHFAEAMSWQDRRKTLLALIGDVEDEAVIASDPDLSELEEILRIPGGTEERYTVDEYLKIAAAKKTEINRELTALPARMDEASRATPGMPGESEEEIRSRISAARKKKSEAEAKRTALKNGGAAASIRVQIENERANLATAQSEEREKEFAATKIHREAIARLQNDKMDVQIQRRSLSRALDDAGNQIAAMKSLRESLIAEYQRVLQEAWDESGATCPTCGRPLPAEEVDKARAAFNLRKSERLTAINERGKREA